MFQKGWGLFVLSCVLSTSNAFAVKARVFSCPIEETYTNSKGKKVTETVTAKFAVSGLEKGPEKAEYEWLSKKAEEEWEYVKVTPKEIDDGNSKFWPTPTRLNDNAALRTIEKDGKAVGIELFGDGDGVDYAYLVLYTDSDYTRGYFKFKAAQKEDDTYQTIKCTYKEKNL